MSAEFGKEIYNQLTYGNRKMMVFSWGAQAFKIFGAESFSQASSHRGGLVFKVNGYLHKGHVMVKLKGNDTYTVSIGRLVKGQFIVKKEIEDCYCDNFAEVIDSEVERISAYKR